ncbi:hypothetical protein E4U15_005938 [Claviceps sp. LM218 group G6]|nr:hypothetical protein E4U15_005938 [Claviceps sp. LM218 group G6]
MTRHEKLTAGQNWTDVTEELVEEVTAIWSATLGPNWKQEMLGNKYTRKIWPSSATLDMRLIPLKGCDPDTIETMMDELKFEVPSISWQFDPTR